MTEERSGKRSEQGLERASSNAERPPAGVPSGAPGAPLLDWSRRTVDYLRLSITDRCNLRCAYCMPEEPTWFPHREILSYEEILRLVRIAVRRGVRKVRLTGGEPLVRRDVHLLVEMLSSEPGVEELSLTTNGLLLDVMAARLLEKCPFPPGERDMIVLQHQFGVKYPEREETVYSTLVDFGGAVFAEAARRGTP